VVIAVAQLADSGCHPPRLCRIPYLRRSQESITTAHYETRKVTGFLFSKCPSKGVNNIPVLFYMLNVQNIIFQKYAKYYFSKICKILFFKNMQNIIFQKCAKYFARK
jgi:hypothetical protein